MDTISTTLDSMSLINNLELSNMLDNRDPLKAYRNKFHIPEVPFEEINGNRVKKSAIYLCGNSLGLQPKDTKIYIEEELRHWAKYGVEGQFLGKNPWVTYNEVCVQQMAEIVGAKFSEVVLMNTLTVNLHLMFTSFYNPTEHRNKILMEAGAFPSDTIAVISNIKARGLDQKDVLIYVEPPMGEDLLHEEDILNIIESQGAEIALVFLGGVNYYTGQVLNMKRISEAAKVKGCNVGFDLAHAVGNIHLELHDWEVDFAVWCTYKYLNSGPGGIGGCFVHEKFSQDFSRPRLAGWWSHKKETRFLMKPDVHLAEGAFGFQISNPSILCLATLRGSLQLYHEVGMKAFVQKSRLLTGYLLKLLEDDEVKQFHGLRITTPTDAEKRGCQISLLVTCVPAKEILMALQSNGIICDFREPSCIRIAPNPFYNSFKDVYDFVELLKQLMRKCTDQNNLVSND